jgi:hypothetical protein
MAGTINSVRLLSKGLITVAANGLADISSSPVNKVAPEASLFLSSLIRLVYKSKIVNVR